ncbi:hypothetical protein F2P56_028600 [Juglans regia]|uniref:Uncharacterized protein n=1 Tax=Juglans regia TaxID=51240 RepID=A0A833UA33_JUGRE|nr:hypothetical protein F2P56_028600 [Juglans regia]
MKGGNGPVIVETVVPTDDAKAEDVALVVEDLEALGAGGGGQSRHHLDLSDSAHVTVAVDDVAALEEVLVGLRLVESSDQGPDGRDGSVDGLDHSGAALVGPEGVGMVEGHQVGYWVDSVVQKRVDLEVFMAVEGSGCGVNIGGIGSVEL